MILAGDNIGNIGLIKIIRISEGQKEEEREEKGMYLHGPFGLGKLSGPFKSRGEPLS